MRIITRINRWLIKKPDLSIIICTEKGELEKYSKLLVKTIRTYSGKFSNTPIYSFEPRKDVGISEETKDFFKVNNVIHNDMLLNKEFLGYPLANKPIVCSYAEQTIRSKYLLFLDSDVAFLNEPIFFDSIINYDVILRPVDSKNIGTSGLSDDPNHDYWEKLYQICGVKSNVKKIHTTVDNREIFPYFNSGHILTKRKLNLFKQWELNFRKVMNSGILPKNGIFFVEQSTFAATVSAMKLNIGFFPKGYNYPIHMQNRPMPEGTFIKSIKDVTSLHYHKLFNSVIDDTTNKFFQQSEKGKWLLEQVEKMKLTKLQ